MSSSSFGDLVSAILNRLPRLNASKFQHGIAYNFLKRASQENLWPKLEQLAAAGLTVDWMIQNDKHLSALLPEPQQQLLRQQSVQIKWMIDVLNDNDLLEMLPPKVVELVGSSDKGRAWMETELAWLREQLGGKK